MKKFNKNNFEIEALLRNWKKINNPGFMNDGIYILEDKLIKTRSDGEEVNKLNNKMIEKLGFCVFPIIYNVYVTPKYTCTEMQRLNGNVTDLLFVELPKYILNSMQIDPNTKDDILFIFDNMIQESSKPKLTVKVSSLHVHLYNKPQKQQTLRTLCNAKKNKPKAFDGFTIPANYNFDKIMGCLKNLSAIENKLFDSTLTLEIFNTFFRLFNEKLHEVLPEICKQITKIQLLLLQFGKTYIDCKLDNFAFNLTSEDKMHLGVKWSNNKFFDKLFNIYAIDWDSGLVDIDNKNNTLQEITKKIISGFNTKLINYAINGTYYFHTTLTPVIQCNCGNIFDLSNDIYNILTKKYKLNLNVPTTTCNTLDEINNLIN